MANIASDVRGVVVGAIEGIYSSLGFSVSPGNVHEYLLEHETEERQTEYLKADISEGRFIRAWGVHVETSERARDTNDANLIRDYNIVIEGYYGLYDNTNPVPTLISHAELVRKAIWDLGLQLSNKVDYSRQINVSPISLTKTAESEDFWSISMQMETIKINPDWNAV